MRKQALVLSALAVTLGGCVSSPKETVLNLDTTDKRWTSARCVAARKEVALYNDKAGMRGVVGVLGNIAAPFAGTATSLAMSKAQDDERARLNHKVRSACISDPLANRREAARTTRQARR
ncbi:hypothetical protein [Phenylobacterium deserti]|uniref:Lipoprotein n=1 Tax=Phenylobacterium deserti TaxID=1914756 RepID=A0A328ARE8_9CAUL|nr:hypothetical protein [Phenylobacterium deserti]RAK57530.1 hypothetical protein DJ018_06235 [Phenylobacterium deserti]